MCSVHSPYANNFEVLKIGCIAIYGRILHQPLGSHSQKGQENRIRALFFSFQYLKMSPTCFTDSILSMCEGSTGYTFIPETALASLNTLRTHITKNLHMDIDTFNGK
jgi:hypothetical protein